MPFLWREEQLSELCNHKDPMVREWAVECFAVLYPEKAGDSVLK